MLTIVCGAQSKIFSVKEALEIELASNIVFRKTRDETWKTIGDVAFSLHKSDKGGIVKVSPCVFDEFPLMHWREYQ